MLKVTVSKLTFELKNEHDSPGERTTRANYRAILITFHIQL